MDRRRLAILFLIVFTNMVGAGVIVPILPLYAFDLLGASELQAALVVSSFFLAQFIAAPVLGRLSDTYGRRPVLMLSQAGTVVSYLLLLAAIPLSERLTELGLVVSAISLGLLIVYFARILDGITGGNVTVAQAYATDISAPENRTQVLGILGSATALGFMIGPAFGGLLAGINLDAPFLGAAFITGITLLLSYLFLVESLDEETREKAKHSTQAKMPLRDVLRLPNVSLILSISLLFYLGFGIFQSSFALYVGRVLFPDSPTNIVARNAGLIITVIAFSITFTQLVLLKPLVRTLGERGVILLANILFIFSVFPISMITESRPFLVAALYVPFGIGFGAAGPSFQGLISRVGDETTRGRMLGILQSSTSISLILGPIIGGTLFQNVGPRTIFFVPGVLLTFTLILSLRLYRKRIEPAQPGFAVAVAAAGSSD